MPEWFQSVLQDGEALPTLEVLAGRLFLALGLGVAVALIHRFTVGSRHDSRTLGTTLVLLAVLISLVTLVIGNSVARAFGLVGALSIVRFRTVVEDTRDTAFVIFAVAAGMACGAGYGLLMALGVPMVILASVIMAAFNRATARGDFLPGLLNVRVAIVKDPRETLKPLLDQYCVEARLVGIATAKQGTSFDMTYRVRVSPANLVSLVASANNVEGIHQAEFKQD